MVISYGRNSDLIILTYTHTPNLQMLSHLKIYDIGWLNVYRSINAVQLEGVVGISEKKMLKQKLYFIKLELYVC